LLFTPGTIHRLINPNRDLELLVVMQNSGLPERGDNVVTFTDEYLADDDSYRDAMTIQSVEEAYCRRDRGVEGFLQLKAAFERGVAADQRALMHFYAQAVRRAAAKYPDWKRVIEQGALAEALQSLQQVQSLPSHDFNYLFQSQHQLISAGD